jgi:hypothetical protein
MTIRYIRFTEDKSQFNLFTSKASHLINQVNCEGKVPTRKNSLFQQFLAIFPDIKIDWKMYCTNGKLKPGKLLRSRRYLESHNKTIVSVAVRNKMNDAVDIKHIDAALKDLVRMAQEWDITSIATVPWGCSSTSKMWENVGKLMAYHLDPLPFEVEIYIGRSAPEFKAIYEQGEMVDVKRIEAPVQDDLVGDPEPESQVAELVLR